MGGGVEVFLAQNSGPKLLGLSCYPNFFFSLLLIFLLWYFYFYTVSIKQVPRPGKDEKRWPFDLKHTQAQLTHTRQPRPPLRPVSALGTHLGSRRRAKSERAPCMAHWLKFLKEVAGVG